MNNIQRNIISAYVIIASILVFTDFLFPGKSCINLLKFVITFSLFFISLCQKKNYKEQWMMFIAHFFVVIADYFFVLSKWLKDGRISNLDKLCGTLFFLIAYLLLIKTWGKNCKHNLGPGEFVLGLLILILFWPVVATISPHLKIPLKLGALLFGLVLYLLVWCGISTGLRGYYGRNTSRFIGLASCLIFISDVAVAHASLNPAFSDKFVSWLSALIWITYIPAWSIIAALIGARNIFI